MKNKLNPINNIPFLTCLVILLLNDFYFKMEYHNWLTGKLSDFCGLFVFVSFWTVFFPNKKRIVYITIALIFIIWKSQYSQVFIDFFSQNIYPIFRVVDITDLVALIVLPLAFYYTPKSNMKLTINPIPLALISLFSFCATSMPEPTKRFEQPQYLLFKSKIINVESSEYPNEYKVYNLDSFLIVDIKEITINEIAPIDDEFHKVQILKDIDLRFLRESKNEYRSQDKLTAYQELRDSLTIDKTTVINLKLGSFTDHLEFKKNRLNGSFKRYLNENNLIIDGKFKNGIEDSVWRFYNRNSEIILKKYFENGELTKTEFFDKSLLKSEYEFKTRSETIRNKHFLLAIISILIIAIIIGIFYNFKKYKNKEILHFNNFTKIVCSFMFPFLTLILAKFLSSIVPKSFSTDLFGLFGETVLVFIILMPLYLVIFLVLKLKNWIDLIYYIILLSLLIVFLEELIYLKNIMYSSLPQI